MQTSFTLKGDNLEEAFDVVSKMEVFTLAESLGGVESLAGHPASMTHSTYSPEERHEFHINDGLIRLSVGLEDLADIQSDLLQALDQLNDPQQLAAALSAAATE